MTGVLRQAGCVAIGGQAVLIEGLPGSGKSSLALALIDRGAVLVGDDGVELASNNGALMALPPPNIEGLLEIRNVGLIRLPVTRAEVSLLVRLDRDAPRLPDSIVSEAILGHQIPVVALYPDSPILALRVEKALQLHGIAQADPSLLPAKRAHRR